MRRVPRCLWWWTTSIPEERRTGVSRFRRWDKALAVVQVTGAVTQISFNRSAAVPVHSIFVWTREVIAENKGSAWAADSVRARRDRPGGLFHDGLPIARLDERAV
jgi:hypothetical protein